MYLGEHLDEFIIVYLNDIIIYLISKKEYREILKGLKETIRRIDLVAIKNTSSLRGRPNLLDLLLKLGYISIDLKN